MKPNILSRIAGVIVGGVMAVTTPVWFIPYSFVRSLIHNHQMGLRFMNPVVAVLGLVFNTITQGSGVLSNIWKGMKMGWKDGLFAALQFPYLQIMAHRLMESCFFVLKAGFTVARTGGSEEAMHMLASSIEELKVVARQLILFCKKNCPNTLREQFNAIFGLIARIAGRQINPAEFSADSLLAQLEGINIQNNALIDKIRNASSIPGDLYRPLTADEVKQAEDICKQHPPKDPSALKAWQNFKKQMDDYEQTTCLITLQTPHELTDPITVVSPGGHECTFSQKALEDHVIACNNAGKEAFHPGTREKLEGDPNDPNAASCHFYKGVSPTIVELVNNIRGALGQFPKPSLKPPGFLGRIMNWIRGTAPVAPAGAEAVVYPYAAAPQPNPNPLMPLYQANVVTQDEKQNGGPDAITPINRPPSPAYFDRPGSLSSPRSQSRLLEQDQQPSPSAPALDVGLQLDEGQDTGLGIGSRGWWPGYTL